MRFWILVLLPLFLLTGCRDKVGPNDHNGGDGGGNEPPPSYVPKSPGNLQADIRVGVGITITWMDSSNNESFFEFCHGQMDAGLACDTLVANTVSYLDSVGLAEAAYHYQIRAVNDSGSSAWVSFDVNYRLQSDGLIPLRAGNWWEYRGAVGDTTGVRRGVREMRLIGGLDYYPLTDSSMAGGTPDTLYYLRNSAAGVTRIPFPPDSSFHADTLFRYPNFVSGFKYLSGADCVMVLNPSPGFGLRVGDSTFTGVVSYQRYIDRDPEHSIRYYLVPHRIGIVREEDYLGTNLVAGRDIVRYHVGN